MTIIISNDIPHYYLYLVSRQRNGADFMRENLALFESIDEANAYKNGRTAASIPDNFFNFEIERVEYYPQKKPIIKEVKDET